MKSEEQSDYWLKRFKGVAKGVPEHFGIADGGKWRYDKSDSWNRQRGRVQTPVVVKPPKVEQPPVQPPDEPAVGDRIFEPGQLVFYRHDGKARLVWSVRQQKWLTGLPQTAQALSKFFKPMMPEMVALWKAALRALNPDMPVDAFEHEWDRLTKSNAGFTNGNGSETDHFKIECGVFCPGATLKVVDGVVYRKGGELWVDVEAIDLNVATSLALMILKGGISILAQYLHVFFFSNTAPTDDKVGNFLMYGGRCVTPLFYPGGRMPVRYARLVAVARAVNPFVPARADLTAGLIG